MPPKKSRQEGGLKFCDLACRFAGFPRDEAVDGAGSCRTFAALYCGKRKALVHKNLPCKDKAERKRPTGSP